MALLPLPTGATIRIEQPSRDHVWGRTIGTVTTLATPVPIPDRPDQFDPPLMTMIAWPPDFPLPANLPMHVSLWIGSRYLGMAELQTDGLRRI